MNNEKGIDLSRQLLEEAERGENEEEHERLPQAKFEGGERTLEKDVSNLDMNMAGLEFEVDPMFHRITAKFDESRTSS